MYERVKHQIYPTRSPNASTGQSEERYSTRERRTTLQVCVRKKRHLHCTTCLHQSLHISGATGPGHIPEAGVFFRARIFFGGNSFVCEISPAMNGWLQ